MIHNKHLQQNSKDLVGEPRGSPTRCNELNNRLKERTKKMKEEKRGKEEQRREERRNEEIRRKEQGKICIVILYFTCLNSLCANSFV